jgi:hypothetical protein
MNPIEKKFKKILTKGGAPMRDICIMISHYLNAIKFYDISPKEVHRLSSTEDIKRNLTLARAYYSKKFHLPMHPPDRKRPENPEKPIYWVDNQYHCSKYDPFTKTWVDIKSPVFPGQGQVFETTTTDHEATQKTDEIDQEKDLLTRLKEHAEKNTEEDPLTELEKLEKLIRQAEER